MAEDTSNLTQNRETFIATFSKCLQDGKTEAKMFFFPLIEVFTSGVEVEGFFNRRDNALKPV